MTALKFILGVSTALLILSTVAWSAEPPVSVLRNRVYVERDSGPLGLEVYLPAGAGPFPGVLVVHGGAWTMGSRLQVGAVAMTLAQHGYTAATISYRLAPKYPFPAQIHDCQAAVRWLRAHAAQLKIDPTRIGGYGYSAGGQLVALLGTLDDDDFREEGVPANAPSARLQAVMAGGAPCDFRLLPLHTRRLAYWLGGTRADKPEAYRTASPAAFITPDDPPMYFFHGVQDMLVPIRSPRRMVELLTASGVSAEMHSVDGAGHIQAFFDSDSLRQAITFADRYLKGDPARVAGNAAEGGASDGQ